MRTFGMARLSASISGDNHEGGVLTPDCQFQVLVSALPTVGQPQADFR